MGTCGVYRITNKTNEKVYIGKSVNCERRFIQHKYELRHDRAKENKHLQNAWNKDGEDSFEFAVLEECTPAKLDSVERKWVKHFKSSDPEFGYNKRGAGGGNGGGEHCEETKQRMCRAKARRIE